MSRGIGEFGPIQDVIPEWLAVIVALLTQLGDPWFLVLILSILYWTRPDKQDDVLLVMAMYLAGLGVYRFLKYVFEFPRPAEPLLDPELLPWIIRPLYEFTAFASGYGFPSGHATASTIVYFGLATVLTAGTKRLRYGLATVVVATVGLTRVALGVHYAVDIVAGVALGLVLLFVGFRVIRHLPGDRVAAVLAFAIVTMLLYVYQSSAHVEAVLGLGVTLGAFAGWQLVVLARKLVGDSNPSQMVGQILLHGGLAAVAIAPLVAALEIFPLLGGDPYPLGGVVGLITAIAVMLPIARHSPHVNRGLTGISVYVSALIGWVRSGLARVVAVLRRDT